MLRLLLSPGRPSFSPSSCYSCAEDRSCPLTRLSVGLSCRTLIKISIGVLPKQLRIFLQQRGETAASSQEPTVNPVHALPKVLTDTTTLPSAPFHFRQDKWEAYVVEMGQYWGGGAENIITAPIPIGSF